MSKSILLHASSEHDSDIYYTTRFWAPDPFTCLIHSGKKSILVSKLEYGRALKDAKVDEVVLLEDVFAKIEKKTTHEAVAALLKDKGISEVTVPGNFPTYFADYLRNKGFAVEAVGGMVFPERACKSEDEIEKISKSVNATESAINEVVKILEDSKIEGDSIIFEGEVLTSEFLRSVMSVYFVRNGYSPARPIVACGDQGCDPHQRGSGKLRPHQSIIVDVFPRSQDTFYWGDITRTFVKGKPSKELRSIYETVVEAQEYGCSLVRDGADGKDIHKKIEELFDKKGYRTTKQNGVPVGFIHGTGHGLGLDIHEYPRISPAGNILSSDMVVTVEPGLYYPGIGGVRIEDDVVVRRNGCQNLVKLEKRFVIE